MTAAPPPQESRGTTAKLAEFAASLRYEHLSSAERTSVRRHLLDTLGAALAGSQADPVRIAARVLGQGDSSGALGAPGLGRQWNELAAAYLGGASAHGMELDDGYRAGSVHPGGTVIPALLAAAQAPHVSGERFMTAIAAGYEVTTRIAEAIHPHSRRRGFHNTPIAGVFGAAAAVASLMGLSTERTEHALGLAASSAAGLFAFLRAGGHVKRLHAGFAAREGLFAAVMANAGMQGPRGVLEARDGFLQAYCGEPNYQVLTADLWPRTAHRPLNITACYIKSYSCCRHIHPALDAVLAMMKESGAAADDIASIEVGTYAIAAEHAHAGWDEADTAQLSYPFCVAVAMRFGAVEIAHFGSEALRDTKTAACAAKVRVAVDPECESNYPQMRAATVVMRLDDGRSFRKFVDEPIGSARHPLPQALLEAKFHKLATPAVGDRAAVRIVELVSALDRLTSLNELFAPLGDRVSWQRGNPTVPLRGTS